MATTASIRIGIDLIIRICSRKIFLLIVKPLGFP